MMGQLPGGQQRLFYSFNLEDHVPAQHLLRSIDQRLDLSDLRAYRRMLEQRYAGQLAGLSQAQGVIAEEYVAHLAETDPRNGFIGRLVAMIRQWLRTTFGDRMAVKWTRGDIVQLLAEARQAISPNDGGNGDTRYRQEPAAEANYEPLPLAEVGEEISGDDMTAFARALYRGQGTQSAFFRQWFGASKMKLKDGTPIAFYHRSFDPRERFDNARLGGNTGTASAQLGHFFAARDVGNVERYGPLVEKFFVKMERPKVVSMAQFEAMGDWSPEKARTYRERLQEQGHDGLWIQGLNWAVAFDGKNVKAVANRGTFDSTDSVRYSLNDGDGEFAATARAYGGEQAWRAAQAAGRTKLDYQQWVEVRTPAYKAKHGDWQALQIQQRLDAMDPLKLKTPDAWDGLDERQKLNALAETLKAMARDGEILHHAELGDVRVGMSGVKKVISASADPAKKVILNQLRGSFESSIYATSAVDMKGRQHTVYHKLLAPIDVDGEQLVAIFTVREDGNGSFFYNAVTVARKEALAAYPGEMNAEVQRSTPANTKASGNFVRRELERVNPDSVTVGLDPQTGEPIMDSGATCYSLTDFAPSWLGGREPFQLTKESAKRQIKGRRADLKPSLLGTLPLSYLQDFAPRSMTALREYLDQKRAMDADRNELHTKYDAIAQRWLKLRWTDRKAERALSDLMHAATLAGIDPSKPFGSRYTPDQRPEYDRLRAQFEAPRHPPATAAQGIISKRSNQPRPTIALAPVT